MLVSEIGFIFKQERFKLSDTTDSDPFLLASVW